MLGAPGSGKGTRAVALCEVLDIVQVATGDLFRNNLKNGTPLGRLAKSYMDKGELVPDDVTAAMVKDRLSQPDTQKGFVLDGFPRTIKQAEMLDKMLAEMNREITAVIYLDVPDEDLKRISAFGFLRKMQDHTIKYTLPRRRRAYATNARATSIHATTANLTVKKRLEVFATQRSRCGFFCKKGLLVNIPPELSKAGAVADMSELCKKLGLIK